MPTEPPRLPTKDVEGTTSGIRFFTWLTLLAGVLVGAAIAWGGWKAENMSTLGWGVGLAVQTVLVCLILFAFAANSENLMAIARNQEIQNAKLEEIRRGATRSE